MAVETLHAHIETPGRLDKALAAAFPDYSRARLQKLVKDGCVRVNGKISHSSSLSLKGGEDIELCVPPSALATPQAEAIALDIVFEDKDIIVINKPVGMVVHPAAGHSGGTLVNALLAHCKKSLSGIGGVLRPGIVHRIDKDTSGLLVAAKNDAAHKGLSAQFAGHTLARTYTAFVWGCPPAKEGTISLPIGRSAGKSTGARKKMAVRAGGKQAITHYKIEKTFGLKASKIICVLETGRTHQIRVHLAHIGCSLIGDPVYGKASGTKAQIRKSASSSAALASLLSFPRQALHAGALAFTHPVTGKKISCKAALPDDLKELEKTLKALEKKA